MEAAVGMGVLGWARGGPTGFVSPWKTQVADGAS